MQGIRDTFYFETLAAAKLQAIKKPLNIERIIAALGDWRPICRVAGRACAFIESCPDQHQHGVRMRPPS